MLLILAETRYQLVISTVTRVLVGQMHYQVLQNKAKQTELAICTLTPVWHVVHTPHIQWVQFHLITMRAGEGLDFSAYLEW